MQIDARRFYEKNLRSNLNTAGKKRLFALLSEYPLPQTLTFAIPGRRRPVVGDVSGVCGKRPRKRSPLKPAHSNPLPNSLTVEFVTQFESNFPISLPFHSDTKSIGSLSGLPPHVPERLDVDSDGVRLAVYLSGPPDAPPMILVHGYPDSARVWEALRGELDARFRVIAYDVRGTGGSAAPRRRGDYRLAQLARDLRAVADASCGARPFHLVAHDWARSSAEKP